MDDVRAYMRTLGLHRRAPGTIRNYGSDLRHLTDWLTEHRGYGPRKATADDLIAYAATRPFTYATQMRLVNAFKLYWRLHLKRTAPCPAESIRVPRKPKMFYRGLEGPEDARLLIKHARAIDPRAEVACALMYFPALRLAEATTLPWDADKGEYLDVMGKGAQPRQPLVHDDLRTILDGWREQTNGSPWVLPSGRTKGHVAANTVYTWVRLAGQAAGLGHVNPHRLRYTAGAVTLDTVGDLRATQEFLGHSRSSIGITAGYTRTVLKRQRELLGAL